jgi:hypothetical protein
MVRVVILSLLILFALPMSSAYAASNFPPPPPPPSGGQSPRTTDPADATVDIVQLLRNRDTRWLMYETDNAVITVGYGNFKRRLDFKNVNTDTELSSFLVRHFSNNALLSTNRYLTGVMMSDFQSVMRGMLMDGDVHVFDKRARAYVERIKRKLDRDDNYMFMDNAVFYRISYGSPEPPPVRACAKIGEQCGGFAATHCCDGLECRIQNPRIVDAAGVCVTRP